MSSRKLQQYFRQTSVALTATFALMLSGCAGAEDAESTEETMGFDHSAEQAEVNDVIADLEPVTLVYQPFASSPSSTEALAAEQFKDEIEQRSNGQITIDIVWGQSIAGFDEMDDALLDGRIDIAHTLPAYDPATYPIYNDLAVFSQYTPASPYVGELASTGIFLETAWESEALISEIEEQGLTPLTPMINAGDFYFWCNEGNPGVETSDWQGRQVRAATETLQTALPAIGSSPVMIESGETFEALQRSTVECTASQSIGIAPGGVESVAPNVSHLSETSFGGMAPAMHVGGSRVGDLPLPYRQIIFDAEPAFLDGWLQGIMTSNVQAVEGALDAGGKIVSLPVEVEQEISDAQQGMSEEAIESGAVPQDLQATFEEYSESWSNIAEELGYSDGGDFATIHEWYEDEDADFRPYMDRIFEDVTLERRPS